MTSIAASLLEKMLFSIGLAALLPMLAPIVVTSRFAYREGERIVVSISDTGSGGTTFRVRLPAAAEGIPG